MTKYHVYPLKEEDEHDLKSEYCKCRPKIEEVGSGKVIIHNSFSGLEIFERALDYIETAQN